MKSKFGKINLKDLGKGLFVTISGGILSGMEQLASSGGQINKISLLPIITTSLISGGSYLIKQLFTNSEGDLMAKESN